MGEPVRISKICGKRDLKTYFPSSEFVLPTCCIGLEFEYEGAQNLHMHVQQRAHESFWCVKEDRSLRAGGAEFVLVEPLAGADLSRAIVQLENFIKDCGRTPEAGARASVHVHLDVRDIELIQALRVAMLAFVMEGGMFHFAGAMRRYNNFCVGNTQASGMLNYMSDLLQVANEDDARMQLHEMTGGGGQAYRYNAVNLACLSDLGSIEFRHHEATLDFARIKNWINIILSLKKYVMDRGDSVFSEEWFAQFSQRGPRAIAEDIFGPLVVKLEYDSLDYSMYEGMRLVQEIVYADKMNKAAMFQKKRTRKPKVVDEALLDPARFANMAIPAGVLVHGRAGLVAMDMANVEARVAVDFEARLGDAIADEPEEEPDDADLEDLERDEEPNEDNEDGA